MFRFSIRELMLASALIGVAISWLVSRANESELKREIEHEKEKAVLIDRFVRYAGYAVNGDESEVILTSPEWKVRSASNYLDVSQRSNGAHYRIWSYQPDFPASCSPSRPAW
jgi:hypothetical protein